MLVPTADVFERYLKNYFIFKEVTASIIIPWPITSQSMQATFTFTFDTPKEAHVVTEAIQPEITNKLPKTTLELSQKNNILTLTIKAKDISSLRAACNSYLRWITTAHAITKQV